ncbi:MAG: DNA polymerase IV [Bacteroidia bacterium]|nr:DNA polymerase IV [Bacteroidia bacterium]
MYRDQKRTVVHMDLDTFFVSVERLRDSRLEGKPLIIGGTGGRGVVSSCSYEARKFGVTSAMPMRLARRICPHATVISGDHELYSRYSNLVTEVIRDRAPVFEKSSIDEFYLDLSGMDRFFGAWKWAIELRQFVINETGLPISFGLSINKLVAKVATGEAKPNGQLQVDPGTEQGFLAPLPVSRIPMIGKKTGEFLIQMGVRQVLTLQQIPREMLQRILGKPGIQLWNRARGIDDSPIVPYVERKSISTERTFAEDSTDIVNLRATIAGMTERIAFKLRKENKMTACVTVKIRYANFDTETRQIRVDYTNSDHVLIRKALELFDALYQRRMRLRLVGVRFTNLIYGSHQVNLFEDTEKQIRLHQAIDNIKFKYGAGALMRGTSVCTWQKPEIQPQNYTI